MSLVLVVEKEKHIVERVRDALLSEGWQVEVVDSRDEALRRAAARAPQLVLVSPEVASGGDLLRSFSRAQGGPGSVAMVAESATEVTPTAAALGADEVLRKPFTDQQLRLLVSRWFAAGRAVHAPAKPDDSERALTSAEIFGDLLAEVESEGPAFLVPPPAAPAAPPAPSAPPPAAKPRPAAARSGGRMADIDELLSKTLSGLEVGTTPRRATAKPPAAAAAPPPPAPSAPPPAEPIAPPSPVAPPPTAEEAAAEVAPPPAEPEAPPIVEAPAPPVLASFAPAPELPLPEAAPEIETPVAAEVAPVPPPEPEPPAVVETPRPQAPPVPPTPRPAAERGPRKTPAAAIDLSELEQLARPKTKSGSFSMPPAAKKTDSFATQRVSVPVTAGGEFGQYQLLEKIAVGGMAEVWKARKRGAEGFQKTVAIKRILPHLTDSSDFVTMFIDEAKLAAQLDHNNVIHIHDLGKVGDDFFIAMEFVDGRDLRSILNRAREKNQPLPMGLALLIASRLASALDYAHRKKDFEGRELGLVHRDVSPQNVLISFEGDIKLCDFGIVKAVSKASKTQMGALKGKLQYMSPEQAWGRPVDGRSDLFSLGSLLFEMLTGRRLFAGDSEMSVLEAVREGRIAKPRDLDARIPLEVNTLVVRALAKEPADRYPTAGEMQRELEKVLFGLKPTPGQNDLAQYVRRLYDLEPRAGEDATAAAAAAAGAAPAVAAASPVAAAAAREVPALEPAAGAAPQLPAEGESKKVLWGGLAAAAVVGIALYLFLGRGAAPPAAPAGEPAPTPEPSAAAALATSEPSASTPVPSPATPTAAAVATATPTPTATIADATPTAAPVAASPALPVATATPAPVVETPTPQPVATEPPQPVNTPTPEPAERATAAPAAPAVREGEVVELGPGVRPPKLVSVSKPQYPPVARRMKLQGEVQVGILVDENGLPAEVKLLKGFPQNVGFNEAALAAARTARFEPASKGGVRVKVWFSLKVPFQL